MNSPFNAQQLDTLYELVTHLNKQLAAYGLELVDGDIRELPVLPAEAFLNAPELHRPVSYYDRLWRNGWITVIELAREGLRPTANGKHVTTIPGVQQPPRSRR